MMTQHENEYLDMQEFQDRMSALSAQIETVGKLQTKMRFVKGVNQTMALECDRLSPGFISSRNPVGAYSVLPTSTNFKLTLEELDKLQIGALVVLSGIALAIVWKLVKMIKKWFGGGEGGDKDGSGGDSSKFVPPDRANAIINDGLDIANSIEQIKKDLVSAMMKSGAVDQITANKEIDEAITKGYAHLHGKITQLFDDFVTQTGPVKNMLKLFEGSLKEAPTKLRDAYNRVEQIIDAYTNSTDAGARAEEVKKLVTMNDDTGEGKSFWYAGDIPEASSSHVLMQHMRNSIHASKLEAYPSDSLKIAVIIDKMRTGLHGAYQKLCADVLRLNSEVSTDLSNKLESLTKKVKRDLSNLTAGDDNKDFVKATELLFITLNNDILAVGKATEAAAILTEGYGDVLKALPDAHAIIIDDLSSTSNKFKATDVKVALARLKTQNEKQRKAAKIK